jgi:membrane-associated phospholipid phosphatase
LQQKPYTSYNAFFIIPFLVWVVAGAVLLMCYDKQVLFATVNMNHNPFLDTLMLFASRMGEGGLIAVVLLALLALKPFRNPWYFTAALVCNVLPALAIQVLKRIFEAPRPLNYFNEAAWIHVSTEWPRLYHHSFPSGHATGAFCFFGFLSCLLPAKYRYIGGLFFGFALLTALSRLYLAAHFFADIYVGSLVGTTMMLTGLSLMRRYRRRFFKDKPLMTTT